MPKRYESFSPSSVSCGQATGRGRRRPRRLGSRLAAGASAAVHAAVYRHSCGPAQHSGCTRQRARHGVPRPMGAGPPAWASKCSWWSCSRQAGRRGHQRRQACLPCPSRGSKGKLPWLLQSARQACPLVAPACFATCTPVQPGAKPLQLGNWQAGARQLWRRRTLAQMHWQRAAVITAAGGALKCGRSPLLPPSGVLTGWGGVPASGGQLLIESPRVQWFARSRAHLL